MIRWQQSGPIVKLVLDRDGARNALPIAAWDALADAAAAIATSDARVVLLGSGMPGVFCAGADLAEFRQLIDDPTRRVRFREAMRAGIEGLAALPMPVIAAVDGGCFGAAVAITLACDIVVAGEAAEFATTPAKLGLSYPASDIARLEARVGEGRAAFMLFTGERLDATAAVKIGLADLRAPNAALKAQDLAQAVAANAPEAIRKLKRALRDPELPEHDAAFDDAFGSAAFGERLGAFLAGKR